MKLFLILFFLSMSCVIPRDVHTRPQDSEESKVENSVKRPVKRKKKKRKKRSIVKKDRQGNRYIRLGSTVPKVGEGSVIGNNIDYGLNLFFNKVNMAGGIDGIEFKIDVRDDARQVVRSRENIDEIRKKTPFIISPFGTRTLIAIKDLLEKEKVLVLFPFAGSLEMRKPEYENLFYFRGSTMAEIKALIKYSIETLQREKIALFYEDSIQGTIAYEYARKLLKERGIKFEMSASYQAGTVNIANAVRTIVASAPHAVICIAEAKPSYYFIRQAINRGLHNCMFLGTSRLVAIQRVLKKSRGVTKLITSSLVPNPVASRLAIAKEYRADMKRFLPNISITPISFEAYIAGAIFTKCLKDIGKPYTVEKLKDKLEDLYEEEYKGLKLSFDTDSRTLSPYVWINVGARKVWPMMKITEKQIARERKKLKVDEQALKKKAAAEEQSDVAGEPISTDEPSDVIEETTSNEEGN